MSFLFEATIRVNEYMVDEPGFIDDLRLVIADTEEAARAKYDAFWKGKSDYHGGTTYSVWSLEVTETLI